jgi:hypothetical protein
MREWLVIENSWKNGVFAPDDAKTPRGYIPRDVVEPLLGRKIEHGRVTWFTKEDGEKMRAHPEWRDDEPPMAAPIKRSED